MFAYPRDLRSLALGALTAIPLLFLAGAGQAQQNVDVELVLAVDVSLSMSPGEMEIQRRGYASALTDDSVIGAIEAGRHGRIAIAYFEWAGDFSQRLVVPWTVIASAEDAAHVADMLEINPPRSARRTSISGAMNFAADLFAESSYSGERRIVDISGDGPNNQGAPVEEAQGRLIEAGITINGLPLMTDAGATSTYDVENLDQYYTECVIGGVGAFMIPVNDWSQFPEAVRRKLVMEIAGYTPSPRELPVINVQAQASTDCLIGEKMWQDRIWRWRDDPTVGPSIP
ncbi:DUF1194 domain-containing protein [Chelativorans sp. YIM 93263]|uniref:DUF1194 domain-containing protein n=1 Tax=Chelativorans sp. YIM 93263 TaxID=2906648 RepID=UPI00237A000B|nr:DUF1194 domain-containing protein [Chelativorans sp. YIM 93263]